MAATQNKQSNKTSLTKRRISAPKQLQLICAILIFLLDIGVLIAALINTLEIKYLVCPGILLVLDLVFIFKVIFSNYRFHYAIIGTVVHIACVVLASAASLLLSMVFDNRFVFEQIALFAMPAVHLLQCIVSAVNTWQASQKKNLPRRIVAAVMTVLLLAGIGIYANNLITSGFFGQGIDRKDRTLVFTLDSSGEYYVASDVLKGMGNTITIPESFNGLPVKAVDCSLFENTELSYVVFNCASDIEFRNPGALTRANEGLTLETSQKKLDDIRNKLYTLSRTNAELLHLANNLYPDDVQEGDVYVVFRYDKRTLELIDGNVLPTWFGKKGEKFEPFDDSQYTKYSYMEHSDAYDEADLYWCSVNLDNNILRRFCDEDGNNIVNTAVNTSVEVTAQFDKIYKICFNDDNDEKYVIDSSYTGMEAEDGHKPYKLSVKENILALISNVPERQGFDLEWAAGNEKKYGLEDIDKELERLDGENDNILEMYPTWTLRDPVIEFVLADGKDKNHSAIYGEDVSLTSQANAPHSTISLKYEWVRAGATLDEGQEYRIVNIHPEDAGEYTLRVTAYADFTSLTSVIEQSIDVGFEKKVLHFDWYLPTDTVYSATDKTVSVLPNDSINNDVIYAKLSQDSVRNAGKYTISITLYGDTAAKYRTADSDVERTVTIAPYPVDVIWEEERSFVYNGQNQAPIATAMGLKNDGAITIQVSGKEKNAGTNYKATASTKNTNYELRGNTVDYEITQRPITNIVWGVQDVEYNAEAQGREISSLINCISADRVTVLENMIYEGKQTNVGTYFIEAVLPEGSNYYFDCATMAEYSIKPADLNVSIDALDKIYDGMTFSDFTFTATGLKGKDTAEEVFELSYHGEATEAINVRETAYAVNAIAFPSEKYDNYNISITAGSLLIKKRDLMLTVDDKQKVYDGRLFSANLCTFTESGLASTDTIDSVLTVVFKGDALIQKGANTWTIDAEYIPGEKIGNYDISIVSGTLTINKAPITVTAVGGNKTYDGHPYNEFDFLVEGLVGSDTKNDLGYVNYYGVATENKNVGTHTVSVKLNSNAVTDNYDPMYINGTVTVYPKDLTITVEDGSKVYDGRKGGTFTLSADGLVSGDSISDFGMPIYSGSATENKDVNEYEVSVVFANNAATCNYNISYESGKFSITPRNVTVRVTVKTKVYDGRETYDFDYTVSGLVSGEAKSILGEPSFGGDGFGAMNVGNYTVSVSLPGHSNYNITSFVSNTLQITKATLNVTAHAQEKTYDGIVGGVFSYTVKGLQGDDTAEILGDPIYSGDAMTAKNAGQYGLDVSFAEDLQNYNVVCTSGKFVIKKASLKITPDSKEKVYDGKVLEGFTFKTEGLVAGDTVEMLGEPIWNGKAISQTNAGEYNLRVRLLDNPVLVNYDVKYDDGVMCYILKKALTVTAVAEERSYEKNKVGGNFSFTAEGLVDGDSIDNFNPIYSGPATQATEVGEYTLSVNFSDTGKALNYDITYIDATFVISEANADEQS